MRTLITHDPFLESNEAKSWRERGQWPAAWIGCAGAGSSPFVTAYRRLFTLDQPARVRIQVAADERYDLYLDGRWIGRGNERGAPDLWFYETYDLPLSAGDHRLVARVWSLGEMAADAQMSVHPGFLLAAEGPWLDLLSTGLSAWEAGVLPGYTFLPPHPAHWRGARVQVDGAAFAWDYESGHSARVDWQPAVTLKPAVGRLVDWEFHRQHLLRPATLPPLLNREFTAGRARFVGAADAAELSKTPVRAEDHLGGEEEQWNQLLNRKGSVTIPAHTGRRVIIDLENYYCFFPDLLVTGGAGSRVRLHSAEALYRHAEPAAPGGSNWDKGNRGEIEGKYFIGFGDTFLPGGEAQQRFDTLWWQAGRYLEILVYTADQPLTIDGLHLRETRYPLEMESAFAASDPRLEQVLPILVRGMQMCSNETFFDCPYYEELQYAGDTRLEILTTYMMTRDERLPRKALRMFDASRLASGLTQSRYPSRVMQIIPPFSLWWVMMVRDYALWRGDPEVLRSLLPGARATVDSFQPYIQPDGLLHGREGWNIMDWVPAWDADAGVPPDGHSGASGLLNWQMVYAQAALADLEERLGETLPAQMFRERAQALARCATPAFWDASRGLMADDRTHQHFSEHTQCMALLADSLLPGLLDPALRERLASALLTETEMERTTIYFTHYLFETYRQLGRVDALFERLGLWFGLVEQGFKTPVEMPEPSRSDCHAWGSHPLYHYFATILGIRPAALGFKEVEIAPQHGPLESASGKLVHPNGGLIEVEFHFEGKRLTGQVKLPAKVTGRLVWNGETIALRAGTTRISA